MYIMYNYIDTHTLRMYVWKERKRFSLVSPEDYSNTAHLSMCPNSKAPSFQGRKAYLDRVLCQSHGPNAYLRRRYLLNKGQHVRSVRASENRQRNPSLHSRVHYVTS